MSEKDLKKLNTDSFDELFRSALSENLAAELPTEEEETIIPVFSEEFRANIAELIARADEIAGEETAHAAAETMPKESSAEIGTDAKEEAAQEKPASVQAVSESKQEETAASSKVTGPAEHAGRSRAETEQKHKIISFENILKHRKTLVNAASLMLVFGLGFAFLKGGGAFSLSKGARTEATGAARAMDETAASYVEETAAKDAMQEAGSASGDTGDAGVSMAFAESAAPLIPEGEAAAPEGALGEEIVGAAPAAAEEADGLEETAGRMAPSMAAAEAEQLRSRGAEADSAGPEGKALAGSGDTAAVKAGTAPAAGDIRQAGEPETTAGAGSYSTGTADTVETNSAPGPVHAETEAAAVPAALTETEAAENSAEEATGLEETVLGEAGGAESAAADKNTGTAGGQGMMLSETGAAGTQENGVQSAPGSAAVPNPIREVAGTAAFAEELDISMPAPETLGTEFSYSIISDTIAQVNYESKKLGSEVTYRAADSEAGDTAGVYYTFDESSPSQRSVLLEEPDVMRAQGITVTFTTDKEVTGALARWSYNGANYSLWIEDASAGDEAILDEAEALLRAAWEQNQNLQ